MKKSEKKERKITKGTSSAVLLSILIHAGLFLLAGMLVVFTVVKQKEVEFEPPKAVERPKMRLKKPKVKVKKASAPRTAKIVSQSTRPSMPVIDLPDMGGIGDGLGADIGAFDLMPEMTEISILGGGQAIGNDFVGHFYDLNRHRNGRRVEMHPQEFIDVMTRFVQGGWKRDKLRKYYRSEKELYTTHFAIPPLHSTVAPRAFGEPDSSGYCFAVLYEGKLVYKDDITFRFWGLGDDFITVRVDNQVVLHAPYPRTDWRDTQQVAYPWQSNSGQSRTHWLGCQLSVVGDWITLKAGEPLDMEVLIGEVPGGLFQALLTVEVKGEEYPRNPSRNGPILPIFKTAVLSRDMAEKIAADLNPYDACLTNGPVFCDFDTTSLTTPSTVEVSEADEPEQLAASVVEESATRVWTNRITGESHEAEYVTMIGREVVLETAAGKKLTFSFSELSEEDQIYLTLANPPTFDINFSRTSRSIPPPQPGPYEGDMRPLQINDWNFEVKIKQSGTGDYPRELTVEYFAFGEEIDGDNYVLLDRGEASFIPADEKKGTYSFGSEKPIRLQKTAIRSASPMRGTKMGGYLVTIKNERGEIIQYKTTADWLFEKLEEIKKIPVGRHFNKEGERVWPPRPGPADRPYWV